MGETIDQVDAILIAVQALEGEDQIDLRCTKQRVLVVEKNAKCLLGQQAASLFIAVIVLKTTEDLIREDLMIEVLEDLEMTIGRCLMRYAQIAQRTVRCLFSQAKEDKFFVVTAFKTKEEILDAQIISVEIARFLIKKSLRH